MSLLFDLKAEKVFTVLFLLLYALGFDARIQFLFHLFFSLMHLGDLNHFMVWEELFHWVYLWPTRYHVFLILLID